MEKARVELILRLIPELSDSLTSEMWQETLREFHVALEAAGFGVSPWLEGIYAIDAPLSGQFIVNFVADKDLWIALGSILVGWLAARNGRKIRVKVGDIEAEAQTAEDLEKLLVKAQEIRDRNHPKVIHE